MAGQAFLQIGNGCIAFHFSVGAQGIEQVLILIPAEAGQLFLVFIRQAAVDPFFGGEEFFCIQQVQSLAAGHHHHFFLLRIDHIIDFPADGLQPAEDLITAAVPGNDPAGLIGNNANRTTRYGQDFFNGAAEGLLVTECDLLGLDGVGAAEKAEQDEEAEWVGQGDYF